VVGLVLSGGGARGAYEAGVLRYLCEEFPRETGVHPWFDVVCGTSVGALNASFVAATVDVLDRSISLLARRWTELRVEDMLGIRPTELLRFARNLFGAPAPIENEGESTRPPGERIGGLLDTRHLERFVLESVPWGRIQKNLAQGALHALSVSATHVASGKTVVFVDTAGELPPWSRDPHVRAQKTHITPWHALASAAIPLLFPAMPIDGAYYVDGGLRQNTPLSPALRLGADRVLVVSMKYRNHVSPSLARAREEQLPTPFFLLGKTLNALLIDRVDYDLDRLRRTNAIVAAGLTMYGPDFLSQINTLIAGVNGAPLKMVKELLVRPSEDLGRIAAEIARSDAFAERDGVTTRMLRRLANAERGDDSDFLSYLFFDGGYGARLLELGMADARAKKEELLAFFEG
jgi:NTE family protein